MRLQILAPSAAALLVFAGCQENTGPREPLPTFRVQATILETNTCSVNALGKSYSSIGQIRGDVPSQFIGTRADLAYHGFGCWVATDGGDGDLVVIFSGSHFGKALEPGTYPLRKELLPDTPVGYASVSFRPSSLENGHRLRTLDTSVGSVVVEATPTGGRTIRVDVEAVEWGPIF